MGSTVIFVNTRPTRSEAEPPFWAAAGLGLRVVVIGDAPPPVPSSLYGEFAQADTYDFKQLRVVAREVSSRHEVVGVVCWGDRDVEGVAHVADELGLAGNSVEAARRARNKHLARQYLSKHDKTLIPKFASVRSLAELEEALPQVPLPAVLKPAGASASKGIFTVRTQAEARAAAGKLLQYTTAEIDPIFRYYPGELVLEQFLEGTEHSVEGIVVGGELLTAVVTDKFVDPAFSIETHQIQPSGLSEETQKACLAAAQTVATALELGTTAIHLELKVDGAPVRVIELNSRTGAATSRLTSYRSVAATTSSGTY
jgi:biotin carboxylase